MTATTVPPPGFDERHFGLAADHGIGRERILFVRSSEGMRSEALRLGVERNVVDGFGDSIWGVRICDVLGEPGAFLVIKGPLTEDVHAATFARLHSQGRHPSPRFLATGEPEFLYAFVLLHELAHHVLAHGKVSADDEKEKQEREADSWAWSELKKHWNLFPAPGPKT